MELENISLSEVSQFRRAKVTWFFFFSYVECRYYYEKQVMLRGGHIQEGKFKRRKLRSEFG
jgi:hypothetical protein